jgi:hypothetical protein
MMRTYVFLLLVVIAFCIGHWRGYISGQKEASERAINNDGFKEGLKCGRLPTYEFPDVEGLVLSLCAEQNINTDKSFLVTCPKCGYARYESVNGGARIFGFLAVPPANSSLITIDQSREAIIETHLQCGGCNHLFGSDWSVF